MRIENQRSINRPWGLTTKSLISGLVFQSAEVTFDAVDDAVVAGGLGFPATVLCVVAERCRCAMAVGVIASPGHPYQVDDVALESPERTSVPSSSVHRSPTVLIIITRGAVRRQAPAPNWIGPSSIRRASQRAGWPSFDATPIGASTTATPRSASRPPSSSSAASSTTATDGTPAEHLSAQVLSRWREPLVLGRSQPVDHIADEANPNLVPERHD